MRIFGFRLLYVPVLVLLALNISGCGYFVTTKVYENEKEKSQSQLKFFRKQIVAHTKILANHGKSINEVQLQLREAASKARELDKLGRGVDKSIKRAIKDSSRDTLAKIQKTPLVGKSLEEGFPVGLSLFVRSTYRGLPLNFAGGYRTPRGRRYPYKLPPGTLVQVLSADKRGFTHIRVKSGRWKGKNMWVRTRWLIKKSNSKIHARGKG